MICQECGDPIAGYGVKYCSRSCGVSANNRRHPKRGRRSLSPCVVCDVPCRFLTCSARCHQERLYRTYIERWLAGAEAGGSSHGVSAYVRRYLIEIRGERCEVCGWHAVHPVTQRVPLEIHHLAGNDDHSLAQLQLLCPNDHALTDSYRGLNRGQGRAYRRSPAPTPGD
jgi:hypothetical protein